MKLKMIKNFTISFLTAILISCGSSSQSQSQDEMQSKQSDKEAENRAMEMVISGSLSEMKGNYDKAIKEYQTALELSPSPGIHFSLGKNYYRVNKLSPALKHAKEAVNSDTTNSEYNYLLANIYKAASQRDSAANIYERIMSIDSTDETAYYSLAKLYEKDQPIKALELYEKLIDLVGPEWNILVEIADLNERMGNVEETIKTIEELTEVDPSNLRIRKLLIESYLKTNKYDKALEEADDLLIQYPDDTNLLEYRANALVQSGNWEEGSKEYKKLSRRDDMSLNSKIKIGAAFFGHSSQDSSSIESAKEIFETIDSDTTHWQVKLYLAQIALSEMKDSVAADYFYEAADLAPWNPQIFMSLGGLLFDTGRYEEAIELLEPAIERFPDEFVLNLILGLSYTQDAQYNEAESYLKKALLMEPGEFTALYAYGVVLNQLDKFEEALIYLNQALEQDPENVSLMGTAGLIHENLGDHQKSEELYEKALEINPTNALVLNNYSYSLAEREKDLDRALQMAKEAIAFDSTNSSYLDTIGWVYFKLGEYEKAKYYIEKSLENDPENAEVLDHLGDVYFKLNDNAKAKEYWERAYEIDPVRDGLMEKIEKGRL